MLELFASLTFQSLCNITITICTAQLQCRSALCFISLIKYLNLVGLLEIFCIHILDIPITAHDQHPNHHLHPSTSSQTSYLFIYLIKSLNLAGLLQYFTITSSMFLLILIVHAPTWAQDLQTPIHHTQCIAGCGWCCKWAGHCSWWQLVWQSWQAAAESPSKPAPVVRHALAGTGKAAVNKPNVMWLGSMHGLVPELLASKPAGPGRSRNSKYVLSNYQYIDVCTLRKSEKCSTW
jgi:hypothetical protein